MPKKGARSVAEALEPGVLEMSDEDLRTAALGNWMQLNAVLRKAAPALVHRLFALELRSPGPRLQILNRLYGRLAVLRAARERRALEAYVGGLGHDGGAGGEDDPGGARVRASEGVIRDLAPQGRGGWS